MLHKNKVLDFQAVLAKYVSAKKQRGDEKGNSKGTAHNNCANKDASAI